MISQADISSSLAASTQSLAQLRAQAKSSPNQALQATAKQFEAVFLNMMLKSMRDATPQDGMFDNEQTKMFTGMLDQQLAQSMANQGGVGLADMIVKQLSRQVGTAASQGAAQSGSSGLSNGASGKASPAGGAAAGSGASATQAANSIPSAYSDSFQQTFVQQMTPYALQASNATGAPAAVMLGQAALESGWGQRVIRNTDGSNSYNLFGIKAGPNWTGPVATVTTTEYRNGVATKQVAKFRSYSSYAAAFSDYANLISSNPRYSGVMQAGQNAPAAAQALQNAGYATDPNYADKLVKVMGRISTLSG
jgi:flagellar protein FlgJ